MCRPGCRPSKGSRRPTRQPGRPRRPPSPSTSPKPKRRPRSPACNAWPAARPPCTASLRAASASAAWAGKRAASASTSGPRGSDVAAPKARAAAISIVVSRCPGGRVERLRSMSVWSLLHFPVWHIAWPSRRGTCTVVRQCHARKVGGISSRSPSAFRRGRMPRFSKRRRHGGKQRITLVDGTASAALSWSAGTLLRSSGTLFAPSEPTVGLHVRHRVAAPEAVIALATLAEPCATASPTTVQKDAPTAWVGTPPSSPRPGHPASGFRGHRCPATCLPRRRVAPFRFRR